MKSLLSLLETIEWSGHEGMEVCPFCDGAGCEHSYLGCDLGDLISRLRDIAYSFYPYAEHFVVLMWLEGEANCGIRE